MLVRKVMFRAPALPSSNGVLSGNFATNETPFSYGGKFSKNAVNSFSQMRVNSNHLEGTNGTNNAYDDSYTHANSFISNHYRIEADVFVDGTIDTGISHEVECLGRLTDNNSQVFGYEYNFAIYGAVGAARWDGPIGGFTFVTGSGPSSIGRNFQTGDKLRVDVFSGDHTMYGNGSFMFGFHDEVYKTGQPGYGGFARPDPAPNNGNPKFCFSVFTITPLP